jgi:Flp pilus assembly protein TadD
MGIVLDAAGKTAEARAAFERARNLPGLPAELANHIEQRLR